MAKPSKSPFESSRQALVQAHRLERKNCIARRLVKVLERYQAEDVVYDPSTGRITDDAFDPAVLLEDHKRNGRVRIRMTAYPVDYFQRTLSVFVKDAIDAERKLAAYYKELYG
jgi:hypothetical protein